MFVEFLLPQQQLDQVRPGLPVRLSSDAVNASVIGTISAINPKIDEATRNVRLQATVANREGGLRPGMFVTVEIELPGEREVVSLVLIIAGLQATQTLNVRQYPRNDNAVVIVTTAYIGASAELVRGFITTPLERAIAAADGIDYIESQSAQNLSTIKVRLRLNYDPTKALAEISSKIDQVRNDLPPEAEVPIFNIESADSPFASAYLSFTSEIL